MTRNDDTLLESRRSSLVAAGIRGDDSDQELTLRELSADDPRLRVLALRSAMRHGWATSQVIHRSLIDPSDDVRREVATLLAQSDDIDDATIDALVHALDDRNPLVVDAAAFALGEQLAVTAVERLIWVATDHEDPRCRECAIAALGAIGDVRATATILNALNDKAPIRRRAVVALANFEGDEVDSALENAREDRDWQVRAAIDQLDRSPNED